MDGRGASGFVGLKNGGATCYMNSVLQHLFLIPGVAEDILAVCSDKENEDRLDMNFVGIIIISSVKYREILLIRHMRMIGCFMKIKCLLIKKT